MNKEKSWVALHYQLPQGRASASTAHKEIFGYKWKEKKEVGKSIKEYRREIRGAIRGVPHVRIGRGLVLVPPENAQKVGKLLRKKGCRVTTLGRAAGSEQRYVASNALFLGQWQSYLAGLDTFLDLAEKADPSLLKEYVNKAIGLADRLIVNLKEVPAPAVPEDLETLTYRPALRQISTLTEKDPERAKEELKALHEQVKAQSETVMRQGKEIIATL